MSSEEPIRSVPDELFRKVSAKPERQLPDALFGGPTPAAREPEATSEDASGSAVENNGRSEFVGESDAEDDVSGGIVAGAEPRPHAAADTSPVAITSDASEPVAELTEALGESVASAADGAGAADGESFAAAPNGSAESGEPVAMNAVAAIAESVAAAPIGFAAESGEPVASAADKLAADALAESVAPDGPAAVLGESVADGSAADAISAPTDAVIEPATAPTGPAVSAEAELAASESAAADAESLAAEPAETREAARPVLLVIADSLSYFGPKGGLPADHPRIWPNLVAAELDWDVELVARIGWTCRDAYWALIGDPRVWAAVPRAGAVVFAVGGMDTLPSPLPTALRELIRYVRPPALRRVVRATYNWLQPKLSKLGRPVALPPKVSVDYLEQSRTALAQLRPGLPVVAVLPSVHDCAAYGRVHSGRPRAVEALRAWSGRTSVPLVDLGEAVRDNIFSGEANPDGIHWGWDGHTAVANAMVKTLQEVR
ncbi:Ribonuclease E [Nocardia gamkensis]|nr:Ribonuclease E [Nocardia gamkensis]